MKILRLYIQECGVFHKNVIDFTHEGLAQNIICIAGVNGSGKTTVMELIFNLSMLLNVDLNLFDIPFDRLKPNILTRVEFAQLDVQYKEVVCSLVIGSEDYIQNVENGNQIFIIESLLNKSIFNFENLVVKNPIDIKNKNKSKDALMLNFAKSMKEEPFSKVQTREPKSLSGFVGNLSNNIKESTGKEDITFPEIYLFNSHDREIQDIRYESIPSGAFSYKLSHRYNPKDDDLKKVLIYYEYAYPEVFNKLVEWVNSNVLIGKRIKGIDRKKFNVVIETDKGGIHGLALLSSGEESLLIIAIQIYLKAHENSVFLIDEVDQSLHPEFQERIAEIIFKIQKEKKCQIIISSHSEIIWNMFKSKGLIDLTSMVI